ncbi:MAG: hypothetical protein Q8O86_03440 [Dehalococcoidia bacterium]|nr:hypothetical protein [Dehalococcoidia bacterium]
MPDLLLKAQEYVRRHHPELTDVEPTAAQPSPGITVFTFRKEFATPDGYKITLAVRVTVGDDGTVLKAVTSR